MELETNKRAIAKTAGQHDRDSDVSSSHWYRM
jgi:hypothetical protein